MNTKDCKEYGMCYSVLRKYTRSDRSLTSWKPIVTYSPPYNRGSWTPAEKAQHINYLDLLAAFLGLKSFAANRCAVPFFFTWTILWQ